MRNAFSALVLAISFAVLVPNNGAQAVRAADLSPLPAAVASQSIAASPAVTDSFASTSDRESPQMSWLLAIGFLAVVVVRRLRPD